MGKKIGRTRGTPVEVAWDLPARLPRPTSLEWLTSVSQRDFRGWMTAGESTVVGCRPLGSHRFMQNPPPLRLDRQLLAPFQSRGRLAACSSWSINAHLVVALGLIVAYHSLVLNIVLLAAQAVISVASASWRTGHISAWQGCCLLIAITAFAVLLKHLVFGIRALVTDKYDGASDIDGILLSKDEYPELYQLVEEVAHRLSAPLPDDLRVTHLANCYVVEQRRFGVRPRRRLTLVLGLPQLKVLSQTELQIVIAHELAHFRCHDTTSRVFFCRFLESLRIATEGMDRCGWRFMNPLYWFCQGYYRLGLLFSARVSQWQELRADRLSARVCGGRLSVATLLKEWMATSQFALTVAEYEELLATAVPMPKANIFEMFVSRWREISSEGCKYLQRRLTEEERLSPWDSHPTMQRRIDAISQMPDSGPENGTPAWGLVRNLVQVEDQLHERLFGRQVDQRKPAKAWETRVCVADGFSSVRSRAEH